MSLPGSRSPTPVECEAALREALTEVAETSFFTFVSRCDSELFGEVASAPADEGGPAGDRWIAAHVGFSGTFSGRLSVTMPEALARDLYAAFTGVEPNATLSEGALLDAAGELANMVCGRWLTRSGEGGHFDLHPPEGARMPGGWTPLDERAPAEAGDAHVLLNDTPLRARLTFDAAAG
jgi:hypothetical protein